MEAEKRGGRSWATVVPGLSGLLPFPLAIRCCGVDNPEQTLAVAQMTGPCGENKRKKVLLVRSLSSERQLIRALGEEGWEVEECDGLLRAALRLVRRPYHALVVPEGALSRHGDVLEEVQDLSPGLGIVIRASSPHGVKGKGHFIVSADGPAGLTSALEEFCQEPAVRLGAAAGEENEELRERLAEKNRQIKLLTGGMRRMVPSKADPKAVYREALEVFRQATGARRLSLMLRKNENGDEHLEIVEAQGVSEDIIAETKQPLGKGIAGWVARYDKPFSPSIAVSGQVPGGTSGQYKARSFLSLPVSVTDRVLGVVNLTERQGDRGFAASEMRTLSILAQQTGVWIWYAHRLQELEELARVDDLTFLYNRRYARRALRREISRANRTGTRLALAIADIDRFKHYNDLNGHLAGDRVLKKVARLLSDNARACDIVCRYGGDEFVIILPESGQNEKLGRQQAREILERVRLAVRQAPFQGEEAQPGGSLTLSVGVSTWTEGYKNAEDLVGAADEMLYEAKRQGGDCVVAQAPGG